MAAYVVEVENEGCVHCGHGKQWIVVDPDGIGGGTTYGDEEDAIEIAEMLTDAFEAGTQTLRKEVQ
jgi:hypothetical protein